MQKRLNLASLSLGWRDSRKAVLFFVFVENIDHCELMLHQDCIRVTGDEFAMHGVMARC